VPRYLTCSANTHCMTDGLTLACLAPQAPEPNLGTRANRAINGLPDHAVVRRLLSVVQAGTNDFAPLSPVTSISQRSQFKEDIVEPSVPPREFYLKAYAAIT